MVKESELNGDRERDEDGVKREGISPVFVWIPSLISFVGIVFLLALKLTERQQNSFTSWGWVVFVMVILVVLSFGISLVIYLIASLKNKPEKEREFFGREYCNAKIKKEIKNRFHYRVDDFAETGDSIEGSSMFGDARSGERDLVYYHLYRILEGSRKRYLLACMNMEKVKIDRVIFNQNVMNLTNISETIREYCNRLVDHPEIMVRSEKQFIDTMSGRSQIEKTETPLEKEQREEDEE